MKRSKMTGRVDEHGLSLVELLVYMAIVGIVMGAIYTMFYRQQDSYLVQERVAILQQNLRGAMAMIASDLEMAGYYTCYEQRNILLDWDDSGSAEDPREKIRPLLLGTSNSIVIVKADAEALRPFNSETDRADANNNVIYGNYADLGFDPNDNPYGILIKADLSRAEFFEVNGSGADISVNPAADAGEKFIESYFYSPIDGKSDLIAPVEIIKYSVDAEDTLLRSGTIVAEHIDSLTLSYGVANEMPPATVPMSWTSAISGPDYTGHEVREVAVTLRGSILVSQKLGTKQRSLSSTIKLRNLGMEMM
jgi:type II secretory pathway component PulJ